MLNGHTVRISSRLLPYVSQSDLRNARTAQQFGEEQVVLIMRSIQAGASVEAGQLRVVVDPQGPAIIDAGPDAASLLEESTSCYQRILFALNVHRTPAPEMSRQEKKGMRAREAVAMRVASRALIRNTLLLHRANQCASLWHQQLGAATRSLKDWLAIHETGAVLWTASVALEVGLLSLARRVAEIGLNGARRLLPKES